MDRKEIEEKRKKALKTMAAKRWNQIKTKEQLINSKKPIYYLDVTPRPFLCPVCQGNGLVPGGFYNQVSGTCSSTIVTEKCRSCDGKGIVWS